MPGIERIELLCNERHGTGVTKEAVLGLRVALCRAKEISISEANALDLDAVADALEVRPAAEGVAPVESPPAAERFRKPARSEDLWVVALLLHHQYQDGDFKNSTRRLQGAGSQGGYLAGYVEPVLR